MEQARKWYDSPEYAPVLAIRTRAATSKADLRRRRLARPASVYLARAIRDFGDGFVAILLPVYLTALGLSAFEVGVVATLALLGSAILTLAIGLLGGRRDHRVLLLACFGADGGDGARLRGGQRLRDPAGRRLRRHDQSVGRQHQHLRAARAHACCPAPSRRPQRTRASRATA